MATGTIATTITVAGTSFGTTVSKEGETAILIDLSGAFIVPAGLAGTLSTYTDPDTGILALAEGHGLTTEDTLDVYWDGGVRYAMPITNVNVDGLHVTVDGGAGDSLPQQATEIVAGKRVTCALEIDGGNVVLIGATASARAHLTFEESDDTEVAAVELANSTLPFCWASGAGITNPLDGEPIGKVMVSSGTAVATTVEIKIIYDSVS